MNRPPPLSTLFPYTTLFRSRVELQDGTRRRLSKAEVMDNSQLPAGARVFAGGDLTSQSTGRDRKSTRLNSSHRCISYAVFCLKKKKTKAYDMLRESSN